MLPYLQSAFNNQLNIILIELYGFELGYLLVYTGISHLHKILLYAIVVTNLFLRFSSNAVVLNNNY